MSNAQTIYNYFIGKGLSPAAVAGIVGNLQTESSFSPTALNSAEGAIGIAQWEGGRRTDLQNFAQSEGKSETDLTAQLDFLWHELNTSKKYVLDAMKYMPDPKSAAAEFDEQFEGSSGAARQDRENNAVSVASAASSGNWASVGGSSDAGGGAASDGGGSVANSGPAATPADYSQIQGLQNLFKTIPELKNLLNAAIAKDMPLADFQDAVESTTWWKTHSATVRDNLIEQANDPATWNAKIAQSTLQIQQQAQTLGVTITAAQAKQIASTGLMSGNGTNQAWVNTSIASLMNPNSFKTAGDFNNINGDFATNVTKLQALAASYGINLTPEGYALGAQHMLEGTANLDHYVEQYKAAAKATYPGLSSALDSGMTLTQIAQPYQSAMAQILEVDPSTLSPITTPLIKQALQGQQGTTSGTGSTTPSQMPLWQFENQVRADPNWQKTDNAKASAASLAMQIGRNWGFE